MAHFTDRRHAYKYKSLINRQRFLIRFKRQIKQAVQDAITKRSIKDIDRGEKIALPQSETDEPFFSHGPGGINDTVLAGNKNFVKGDRIPRPPAMKCATQSHASKEGQDYDQFVFNLSREEFLNLFFEDLNLPKLVQKELSDIPGYKFQRAGFATQGPPPNINIIRSMRNAYARRIALKSGYQQQIESLQQTRLSQTTFVTEPEISHTEEEINGLKEKMQNIPFIDDVDIRYNRYEESPKPSTQAVMFCLMDVSGSMDETKKDMAKRFFILLYLFLTRKYESIEVIFIRHHTIAKEVDEQEFFYSRETGGTVVSSALELMSELIDTRYSPSAWNIYVAQASDGDNWNADSPHCQNLLINKVMSQVQYYAYVEILPRQHQSLWHAYQTVKSLYGYFAMQKITRLDEIYPVLAKLFRHEVSHETE